MAATFSDRILVGCVKAYLIRFFVTVWLGIISNVQRRGILSAMCCFI